MRISDKTISALARIILGDQSSTDDTVLSPYNSGPDLVSFFNQFGEQDTYGQGFPSRRSFTISKLEKFNGSPTLAGIIEAALDPRVFLGTNFLVKDAVFFINEYLKFDGYKLRQVGHTYKLRGTDDKLVVVSAPFLDSGKPNHEFIQEQLTKCEQKISDGDYDGAITNARALLEAVLVEMESRLDTTSSSHDGDLIKLYKRVQKLLNLEPSREDLSQSLKQILSGLTSIVNGISSVRNSMSDAHARRYKPQAHHAKLAVNAVHTTVDFLFSTYEYQLHSGNINPIGKHVN
jgi:hypothetical protein